ncbi:hypothetical protein MIDIC_240020 [Alphaproteobacteria bacterium]
MSNTLADSKTVADLANSLRNISVDGLKAQAPAFIHQQFSDNKVQYEMMKMLLEKAEELNVLEPVLEEAGGSSEETSLSRIFQSPNKDVIKYTLKALASQKYQALLNQHIKILLTNQHSECVLDDNFTKQQKEVVISAITQLLKTQNLQAGIGRASKPVFKSQMSKFYDSIKSDDALKNEFFNDLSADNIENVKNLLPDSIVQDKSQFDQQNIISSSGVENKINQQDILPLIANKTDQISVQVKNSTENDSTPITEEKIVVNMTINPLNTPDSQKSMGPDLKKQMLKFFNSTKSGGALKNKQDDRKNIEVPTEKIIPPVNSGDSTGNTGEPKTKTPINVSTTPNNWAERMFAQVKNSTENISTPITEVKVVVNYSSSRVGLKQMSKFFKSIKSGGALKNESQDVKQNIVPTVVNGTMNVTNRTNTKTFEGATSNNGINQTFVKVENNPNGNTNGANFDDTGSTKEIIPNAKVNVIKSLTPQEMQHIFAFQQTQKLYFNLQNVWKNVVPNLDLQAVKYSFNIISANYKVKLADNKAEIVLQEKVWDERWNNIHDIVNKFIQDEKTFQTVSNKQYIQNTAKLIANLKLQTKTAEQLVNQYLADINTAIRQKPDKAMQESFAKLKKPFEHLLSDLKKDITELTIDDKGVKELKAALAQDKSTINLKKALKESLDKAKKEYDKAYELYKLPSTKVYTFYKVTQHADDLKWLIDGFVNSQTLTRKNGEVTKQGYKPIDEAVKWVDQMLKDYIGREHVLSNDIWNGSKLVAGAAAAYFLKNPSLLYTTAADVVQKDTGLVGWLASWFVSEKHIDAWANYYSFADKALFLGIAAATGGLGTAAISAGIQLGTWGINHYTTQDSSLRYIPYVAQNIADIALLRHDLDIGLKGIYKLGVLGAEAAHAVHDIVKTAEAMFPNKGAAWLEQRIPNFGEVWKDTVFLGVVSSFLGDIKNPTALSFIRDYVKAFPAILKWYNGDAIGGTDVQYGLANVAAAFVKPVCKTLVIGVGTYSSAGLGFEASSRLSNYICEPFSRVLNILSEGHQKYNKGHSKDPGFKDVGFIEYCKAHVEWGKVVAQAGIDSLLKTIISDQFGKIVGNLGLTKIASPLSDYLKDIPLLGGKIGQIIIEILNQMVTSYTLVPPTRTVQDSAGKYLVNNVLTEEFMKSVMNLNIEGFKKHVIDFTKIDSEKIGDDVQKVYDTLKFGDFPTQETGIKKPHDTDVPYNNMCALHENECLKIDVLEYLLNTSH